MKEFIEKLIERLEEKIDIIKDEVYRDYEERIIEECAIENVIDIINELAEEYNNDVCEWTEYDYKTIRSPHERDWSIPSMKDFKYCPYCGKKIKVEGVTENE